MPVSFTPAQKKAAATLWPQLGQAPLQFALVAAPDPVLQLYKKPQDAPSGVKVLEAMRRDITGFKGMVVSIGRVEAEGTEIRIVVDRKRSTGQALSQSAFTKAWKAAAKAIGLDRAAQAIDKAVFGEEESEEVEAEGTGGTGAGPRAPDPETAGSETYRPAPGMPSAVAVNRSRIVWTGARGTAAAEFEKLLNAIYADPDVKEVETLRNLAAQLKKTTWSLEAFDDRLVRELDALVAGPATDQAKALQRCNDVLRDYRRALDADPVLADIDENPFKPVAVRKTIATALDELETALRGT